VGFIPIIKKTIAIRIKHQGIPPAKHEEENIGLY
jgi:hypothetical protein